MLVNDEIAIGLSDLGANVSLVYYNFCNKLKINKIICGDNNIEMISGTSKLEDVVSLSVKVFETIKTFPFFEIKSDSFKDDLLLGLDFIKEFKLRQDENFIISQGNFENIEMNFQKKIMTTRNETIEALARTERLRIFCPAAETFSKKVNFMSEQ